MTRLVLKPVCLWMIVDIVVISEDRVISVLLVGKSMAPDLDAAMHVPTTPPFPGLNRARCRYVIKFNRLI